MEFQLANCLQITTKSSDYVTTADIKLKLLELKIWDADYNPDVVKFGNSSSH